MAIANKELHNRKAPLDDLRFTQGEVAMITRVLAAPRDMKLTIKAIGDNSDE